MIISGLVVTLVESAEPASIGDLLADSQATWGQPTGRRYPLVVESPSIELARAAHAALVASSLVSFVDVTYVADTDLKEVPNGGS